MRHVIPILSLSLLFCFSVSCTPPSDSDPTDSAGDQVAEVSADLVVPGDSVPEAVADASAIEDLTDLRPDETSTGDPNRPPDQCATLEDPWGEVALWMDRTDKWNLGVEGLDVLGNRLTSVDLDGDFYPDLIVHFAGSNDRDDPANGSFRRRVLLNRPAEDGGRQFVDFTLDSRYGQIPGTDQMGRAAHFSVFADVDNDGDLDAFSGTYSDRNNATKLPDRSMLLLNDGNGVFSAAPLSDLSPEEEWSTTSAAFLDFDLDGFMDIWEGNFYAVYGYLPGLQDRLYKGNGDGTFTDVTQVSGLSTSTSGYEAGTNHRPTYGVTSCDIDGDGDMDLLQSSYGRQLNMLWLNVGSGVFVNASAETAYAADDNLDYSDNQFYRCYCANEGSGTCDPEPPAPAIECTPGYWSEADTLPYRNGGNTFSTLCADLDGDLDLDVFNAEIVHWHIGNSSDPSQILRNDKSDNQYRFQFTRPGREATGLVRERSGAWNEGDIYVTAFDGDMDGVMDIFLPSSDYDGCHGWYFRGTGGGVFENIDDRAVSGLNLERIGGVAVADFDRDGDLDVVVAYSTMRCDANCEFTRPIVRLFENRVNGRANGTTLTLRGKGAPGGANRAAIGARVLVTAGGTTQVREISGGYGHFGIQNTTDLHFGLGANCVMDRIEVRWPNASHTVSVFENVPANYHLVLEEGAEYPVYLE